MLQHLKRERANLFVEVAKQKGLEVNTCHLYLGHRLPKPKKGDVILIMGGSMGIKDISSPLYPWMKNELDLIKYSLDKEIGLIGVCLGAQLIAFAAGGKIEKLKDIRNQKFIAEVGWGKVKSCSNSNHEAIMSFFESPLDVLHWHEDRIILPEHAKQLASSDLCEEQFFKIGAKAFGLQFHIETDNIMIKEWIKNDREFICRALGKKAQSILYQQELKYSQKSKKNRLKLINGLFNILMPC